MVTTIKTFRGYKVVKEDHVLDEAKAMLRELINEGVVSTNRWCVWTDDNENTHFLTPTEEGLNLNVSTMVHTNIKLKW